jgi:MFS family permease
MAVQVRRPSVAGDPALLSFAGMGLWAGVWAASIPQIQRSTGLNDARLGVAIFLGTAATIPVPLLFGRLSRRFGGAKLLAASLFGFGVFGLLPAVSNSFWTLVVAVALTYVALSLLDVTMNAATAAREQREARHLMQLAHSLFPAALLVATVGVGLVRANKISLLLPFTFAACVCALVGGIAVAKPIVLPVARPDANVTRRSRSVIRLCVVGFLSYSVECSIGVWAAVHMEQTLHAGPFLGAMAPATLAAFAFAGRLTGHRFSGHGQPVLMMCGVVFAVAGITVTATATSPAVALLGFALAGLGYSSWSPAIFSQVGRIAEETRDPQVTGIVLTFSYVGMSFGPAALGVTAGFIGLRAALGTLLVFVAVIAALVARPMFKSRSQANPVALPEALG